MSSSVLVYGRDATLLEVRRLVLERVGLHVSIATKSTDVQRMISAEQIDLLIVCHTIAEEETGKVLSVMHKLRPKMKGLILTVQIASLTDRAGDEMLSTVDGPVALIETVNKMLTSGTDARRQAK
jgi:DNA-binding NtrC family response regulator